MNMLYSEETEKIIKSDIDENFIITGRKINGFFENVAVTCDSLANNLRFTMADTFDGVPLWDKEIKIIYQTPDGYKDFAIPHSLKRENGIMTFSWLLGENVARVAGNVTFAIRISDGDFVWNSLPAVFRVSEGIIESGEEIPEYASEWIETLDEKLSGMPSAIEKCKEMAEETDKKATMHIENKENPHAVTKEQLGLSDVDNTSDMDKPVSTLVKNELNKKAEKADFEKHSSDGDIHITKDERTLWNDKYSKNEVDENLSLKENVSNKSSVIDNAVNDETYPSVKAVKTYVDSRTVPLKTGFSNLQTNLEAKAEKTEVSEIKEDLSELSGRVPRFVEDEANKTQNIGEQYDEISYPSVAAVKYYLQDFSNALKIAASGNPVRIDDVSPIEHSTTVYGNLDTEIQRYGKNLLDVFGRTLGDLKDYDATTARTFELDKYYVGLTANNYYSQVSATAEISDGVWKITSTQAGYGVSFPVKLVPNTTYVVSAVVFGGSVAITFYDEYGAYIKHVSATMSFTVPENCVTAVVNLVPSARNTEAQFYNVQLEVGENKTEYEPYVKAATYYVEENGKVEIQSLFPTMTLLASYGGEPVTISAEYNRDINKAFAQLENAILSLGGNV